jgi:trk system potassium uptake protein TrkA
MRTIIVGCGRVGAGLASQLAGEGHDVVILDITTESFRRLAPDFPGQALRGDGTDESVLERAGARGATWFFALTAGDNRNILAAQLAAQTFGIENVVCKVNDPVRANAYATLGVNTVNRTDMMVDSLARFMGRPGRPGASDVNRAAKPAVDAAIAAIEDAAVKAVESPHVQTPPTSSPTSEPTGDR